MRLTYEMSTRPLFSRRLTNTIHGYSFGTSYERENGETSEKARQSRQSENIPVRVTSRKRARAKKRTRGGLASTMVARNREGFRSIISYGGVLDGNDLGCCSFSPRSLWFSTEGEEECLMCGEKGRKVERLLEESKEGETAGDGDLCGVGGCDLTARRDLKSGEDKRQGKVFADRRRDLHVRAQRRVVPWLMRDSGHWRSIKSCTKSFRIERRFENRKMRRRNMTVLMELLMRLSNIQIRRFRQNVLDIII